MSGRIKYFVKRTTSGVMHDAIYGRDRKRAIAKIADKTGLIFFGNVDQHSDDYRVTRGFTVSPTHRDNNYTVGSLDGYDITIVDRNNLVHQKDGSLELLNWVIIVIDLHTVQEIPHIFINSRSHGQKSYMPFYELYKTMHEVRMGTFDNYDTDFTSRFAVYAQPTQAIEVERLFPNAVCRVLGAHFWPLSAEIQDGMLYIYSDDKKITPANLETMLECGLWLAKHLDYQSELI